MSFVSEFKSKLSNIQASSFNGLAMDLFRHQAKSIPVYRDFLSYLRIDNKKINSIEEIPFMPISFFKTHKVYNGSADSYYSSSGTTGEVTSKHYYNDESFYLKHAQQLFEQSYQVNLKDCVILALLPSYLERKGSSLVSMCQHFINESGNDLSNFYLYNHEELHQTILSLKASNKKVFLIGVTFGLLDFAEKFSFTGIPITVIETGGMKGKRKEIIREEVHQVLCNKLGVSLIHSEYGMTELLSQSYSKGNGIFKPSSSMKVLIRDLNDPLSNHLQGRGCLNIVDLANIESCAFIATQDLGKVYKNGYFEVNGRIDNSDIRGCNLMIT